MNEQQEREAFDAWFYSGAAKDSPSAIEAWPAWQARSKLAANVPDGYKLVLVPDELADDEPDWDECKRQAEEAYGLKVGDQTMPILIREVRRWIEQKWAAPAPEMKP